MVCVQQTNSTLYDGSVTELVDDGFVSVAAPPKSLHFRPVNVIPEDIFTEFAHNKGVTKEQWTTHPNVKYFNTDLTYL